MLLAFYPKANVDQISDVNGLGYGYRQITFTTIKFSKKNFHIEIYRKILKYIFLKFVTPCSSNFD